MQSEIPHCRLIDFLLLLTSRRRRFRVSGLSMSPLLYPDDEVIVNINHHNSFQVNDVVLLNHPFRPDLVLIKRIKAIESNCPGETKYFVQGDNSKASTDSRHFGLVSPNLLIGKVICRFP